MKRRNYTLRRRAEAQDETRARIVEAAVALHEEVGPARTTISAIAERAGVQRLTVYRHFPQEAALFAACTSLWLADHPPPDPTPWSAIADPVERMRAALNGLFAYYRRTARMWTVSYRDADEVAALRAPLRRFEQGYLGALQRLLLEAWGAAAREPAVQTVVGHCLRFATWQSLVQHGRLAQAESAEACVCWVQALAAARRT